MTFKLLAFIAIAILGCHKTCIYKALLYNRTIKRFSLQKV